MSPIGPWAPVAPVPSLAPAIIALAALLSLAGRKDRFLLDLSIPDAVLEKVRRGVGGHTSDDEQQRQRRDVVGIEQA